MRIYNLKYFMNFRFFKMLKYIVIPQYRKYDRKYFPRFVFFKETIQ